MGGITRLGSCQPYLFGPDSSHSQFMFKAALNAATMRLLDLFVWPLGKVKLVAHKRYPSLALTHGPLWIDGHAIPIAKLGTSQAARGDPGQRSLHLSCYTSFMPSVRPRALLRTSGSRYSRVRHHRKRCSDHSVSAEGRSRSGTGDRGST